MSSEYFYQPCMLCNGLAKVENHNQTVILGCKYGHVGQVIQLWLLHHWIEQIKKYKVTQILWWRLNWFPYNEFFKSATFYYSRVQLIWGTNFTASFWAQVIAKSQCFCLFQFYCTLSTLVVQCLNGDKSDFDKINSPNSQFSPYASPICLRRGLYSVTLSTDYS